jgi:hypothetical protein
MRLGTSLSARARFVGNASTTEFGEHFQQLNDEAAQPPVLDREKSGELTLQLPAFHRARHLHARRRAVASETIEEILLAHTKDP